MCARTANECGKKSILFVINTMGVGGGEKALLELFRCMDPEQYEISLFVLTGQGELFKEIPGYVHILNKKYMPISVLDNPGKTRLFTTVVKAMLVRGTIFRRMGYLLSNLRDMIRKKEIRKDKLMWKILSDGAQRLEKEYDLAVAYLEGGAAYYVASHVKAKKKAAFIHINYTQAGYSRRLDEDSYLRFDRLFTVSESVKEVFLSVYPECADRTVVLYNLLDRGKIIRRSMEEGGFPDDYDGFRILTVGRLVPQKALHLAVTAMKILKVSGKSFRWYVLGEGEMRKKLEEQIRNLGLEEDFILLGTVENPYPYYAQCDLYVHTACFEGKSIAIEEAQILGCAVLVTDYDGVREQVEDGVDGIICKPEASLLAQEILELVGSKNKLLEYGLAASRRKQTDNDKEARKLMDLLGDVC